MNKRTSMAAMGCALLRLSRGCGGNGVASSGDSTSTVTTLEPGMLKVCLYAVFAPFAIKGDDGWSGWDPEHLAAFAKEQGLQFEPVEVGTFNDIWMRPGNDVCDVAGTGITVTEARKQQTGTAIDWTDDYYSVARIAAASLTDVKVEYVNDEAVGTRRVAEAGPDGPIGFAAGAGSTDVLAASIPRIEAAWIHCMMLPDGTESSEPFAFTVRAGSTGVAKALNAFLAVPTTAYAGGPGSGLDCPK